MNIAVIAPGYPYKRNNAYAFVKQLVDEFARQGVSCSVIAPNSVVSNRRICPKVTHEGPEGAASVTVYRPNILSFSGWKLGGKPISRLIRRRAVERALRRLPQQPDLIYGHFWVSGWMGARYAKEHGIPLFVATGESSIAQMFPPSADNRSFLDDVRGVVAVSEKNKRESVALHYTTAERCEVFPNGVDLSIFHPMEQAAARERLRIEKEAFVVIFVGSFIERKGAHRLSEAIGMITGKQVFSIFVGEEGDCKPSCENILYCGKVKHEELPLYLNAADAFVLPTLKEGCCNAIVEAMACGLPIISSDMDFNDGLLDDRNAIRVDPMDVEALAQAIVRLRDDEMLRRQMGAESLRRAQSLRIADRAAAILQFITAKMNQR
ncbi:MAG: glycosyltransferase family 4 protein [Paludibacteraceae bacterium]|nr:glycosyltransferase family 4 protein [Paludibacteraceae bacterium]